MDEPQAFLLGHPVGHSRSPLLHGHWLRTLGLPGRYTAQDVPPDGLEEFFAGLRERGFVGGNVTVPHKVAVMAQVGRLDGAAEAIGAVNTVWLDGGAWVGGNTDAAGFLANMDEQAPGWSGPAAVLGAGGAARAVVHALRRRGVPVSLFNRSAERAAALSARFAPGVTAHGMAELPGLLRGAGLLVNTTALGMQGQPPLELDLSPLPGGATVCDLVYAPLETGLLRTARALRLRTVDGLGMLLHQAVPGFARWFGATPAVTPALRALVEADLRG